MTTALHPDVALAKYRTLKAWTDTRPGNGPRLEELTDWEVSRLEDGSLLASARIDGPNPAAALRAFGAQQEERFARIGDLGAGDQPPTLDYTVPGRTACAWRLDGVWVELWHPDTPVPVPAPPVAVQAPARPVPVPPRRTAVTVTTPSGRLPLGDRIRRTLTTKDN